MLEKIDLRELALVQGHDLAVVSVYLTGAEGVAVVERRAQEIRTMLEGEADATVLEQFDETMKQVRGALEENRITGEGLALFACWGLGFLKGFQLSVRPRRDELRLGPTPYIRPLAELQEEHERFLVVAADSQGARVLEVVSAEVKGEEAVRGDVKGQTKKGGWSQQRYARRRKNQLHHYAKEVAGVLERLTREEGFGRIVLVGADETMREIRESLPKHVAELVVGEKSVDLSARQGAAGVEGMGGEAMEAAWKLYFEAERAAECRLWEQIREQTFAGGLAATGLGEVLAAAEQGRVERALIDRTLSLAAAQCRACDHAAPGTVGEVGKCGACGSGDLFEVSLVNAIVARLERSSAEADFTDPFAGLGKVGGVAALLRY